MKEILLHIPFYALPVPRFAPRAPRFALPVPESTYFSIT